jgi:hypothetical protein
MATLDFPAFARVIRGRIASMFADNNRLFVVDADRDEIWNRYLKGFPPGADPMFRVKTEHDCSCCRHFIRAVGDVVTIKNGALGTVWDVTGLHPAYQAVADAMAAYIRSRRVCDVFLTRFPKAGQEHSFEEKDGHINRWEHFAANIPRQFLCEDPETRRSTLRSTFDVLKRGVEELTPEAVATVVDLIESNALYRGAEFLSQVKAFQQLQANLRGGNEALLWESLDAPAARLRNTVIGQLLIDLSTGVEVEQAVRSFERMVAPTNYKRPVAIITKGMAEQAMKTITELGLESALERRHARFSDVSIGSVLWVDGSVKSKLKGGIEDIIMGSVQPAAFDPQKARPIKIDEFLAMQHKQGVKLYFDNPLVSHLVSMTAPVHPEVKHLFKWNNDFAWSYNGDVADSIKERVKKAGGQVEGIALRASLAWYNFDDLDLHCHAPDNYYSFRNARPHILDVDMNAGGARSREPVENMRWKAPPDGQYVFKVHNYSRRETVDVGFVMEVESALGVSTFRYPKVVNQDDIIDVCTVTVRKGQAVEVVPSSAVTVGAVSQEAWGLKTLDLVKVQAIVLSPNYWDDNAVGNKHWFFILEGCKNPQPCRGIYNEFLNSRLETHRKVFEMVGAKTKCPVADEQLSGVGFSSTRKDQVVVVSNGIPYAIQF